MKTMDNKIDSKIVVWLKWLFSAKVLGVIISLVALIVAWLQVSVSKGGTIKIIWDNQAYDLDNSTVLIYVDPARTRSYTDNPGKKYISLDGLQPFYRNETDITANNVKVLFYLKTPYPGRYNFRSYYNIADDGVRFANKEERLQAFSKLDPCLTDILPKTDDWVVAGRAEIVYDGIKHPIRYDMVIKPFPRDTMQIKKDLIALRSPDVYLRAPGLDEIRYISRMHRKKLIEREDNGWDIISKRPSLFRMTWSVFVMLISVLSMPGALYCCGYMFYEFYKDYKNDEDRGSFMLMIMNVGLLGVILYMAYGLIYIPVVRYGWSIFIYLLI